MAEQKGPTAKLNSSRKQEAEGAVRRMLTQELASVGAELSRLTSGKSSGRKGAPSVAVPGSADLARRIALLRAEQEHLTDLLGMLPPAIGKTSGYGASTAPAQVTYGAKGAELRGRIGKTSGRKF
jgi:hypothetical protein